MPLVVSLLSGQALTARFLDGLNDELKDEIFAQEIPSRLDLLVKLAIQLDKHFDLRRRTRESSHEQRRFSSVTHTFLKSNAEPESMQVGRVIISSSEHQRCIQEGLCLYCGGAGHRAATCPVKEKARQ